LNGVGNGGEREARLLGEKELAGAGVFVGSVPECADFTGKGAGVVHAGTNLDEVLGAVGMAGEEVHLEALGRSDVGDFGTTALEFGKDRGLESVSDVEFAAPVENGNERGVGRIDFAGIDLAAFFRVGGDGDSVEKKSVLEVIEERVEMLARDGDALGFEVGGAFGHRKEAGGVAEQAADKPTEGRGICHVVAFDDVAKEEHVHVTLEQQAALRGVETLGLRETAREEIAREMVIEGSGFSLREQRWIRRCVEGMMA